MAPRADPSANNAAAADVFSCSPPPRGGCGAISLHLRCRCDASAGTPARTRALPAAQRGAIPLGATRRPPREHRLPERCRRHATRHPARARALASRARNRIGAARRPQRDALRSEIGPPMRRASLRLRARASAIQASQEAAWRRAPTPAQTDSRAATHPWGCDASSFDVRRSLIVVCLRRKSFVARRSSLVVRRSPSSFIVVVSRSSFACRRLWSSLLVVVRRFLVRRRSSFVYRRPSSSFVVRRLGSE